MKRHPLVHLYVTTDLAWEDIASHHSVPDDPLSAALRLFLDAGRQKISVEQALRQIESLAADDIPPEMFLLLLPYWTWAAGSVSRPEQAEALIRRARVLITRETPAELRALVERSEAAASGFPGDTELQETARRRALAALPSRSPRYGDELFAMAFFLASVGREDEVDAEIARLARDRPERWESSYAVARLWQCLETGRMTETPLLLEALRRPRSNIDRLATLVAELRVLAELMDGRRPEKCPEWGEAVWALLDRRPGQALGIARRVAAGVMETTRTFGSLLRSELAAGHGEAGLRLLDARRAAGVKHFLDEVDRARGLRLMGSREAAAAAFARGAAACEALGASGRLDFELRLACEMGPGALVSLAMPAGREAAAERTEADRPVARAARATIHGSGVAIEGANRGRPDAPDLRPRGPALRPFR